MHLGLCFGCRIYLLQMKYMLRTVGRLPSAPAPAELREQLLARFRTWQARKKIRTP
jgi:hypothetical protein